MHRKTHISGVTFRPGDPGGHRSRLGGGALVLHRDWGRGNALMGGLRDTWRGEGDGQTDGRAEG